MVSILFGRNPDNLELISILGTFGVHKRFGHSCQNSGDPKKIGLLQAEFFGFEKSCYLVIFKCF